MRCSCRSLTTGARPCRLGPPYDRPTSGILSAPRHGDHRPAFTPMESDRSSGELNIEPRLRQLSADVLFRQNVPQAAGAALPELLDGHGSQFVEGAGRLAEAAEASLAANVDHRARLQSQLLPHPLARWSGAPSCQSALEVRPIYAFLTENRRLVAIQDSTRYSSRRAFIPTSRAHSLYDQASEECKNCINRPHF